MIIAGLLLCFIVGAAALLLRPADSSAVGVAPAIGHVAPDFSLPNIEGETVSLHSLRGRPVLLNFWATWCVPCKSEMPLIDSMYHRNSEHIEVVAIDKQEPASDVRRFVQDLHLSFVPVLDSDGSVFSRYHVSHLQPASFWIDKDGIVRGLSYGAMQRADIDRELRRLGIPSA